LTNVLTEFDNFANLPNESLEAVYYRFCNVINELRKNNVKKTEIELNIKFIKALGPEWEDFGTQIKQHQNLTKFTIHTLYESFKLNENQVLNKASLNKVPEVVSVDPFALIVERKIFEALKRQMVVVSSNEEEGDELDTRDGVSDELSQALAVVTKHFKKKFYKARPINNNLRTASTSAFPKKEHYHPRSHDHGEESGSKYV
jgi:hypothetical protein